MECHMAQHAQVVFTDDIDGSDAADTVRFGLEGTSYEIDLSKKNADKLAKVLEPYIKAARKASSGSRRPAARPRAAGPNPAAVREWAKSEGMEVKDKGRVPAELIVKFQAANAS
jgi:nucleoid-associated protein Lsr2